MNKLALILLTIGATTLSGFAAPERSASIDLRFVPAEEAFAALKEKLGNDAAQAVAKVDARTNSLTLIPTHAQAAKVRDFLAALDVKPRQLIVHGVITRRVEATATKEAHDEVLSRPTAVVREGDRLIFKIPGQDGATSVELRINSVPAPKQ
jgi:hypothetical protein